MFWKLGPPNLIPGPCSRCQTNRVKIVCEQDLSQNSGLIGDPGEKSCPDRNFEQGNVAGRLGIIWPHEPVIKTEIGTGK